MIRPPPSAEYSSSAYLVELAQDGDEDADAIVRRLKLTHGSDTLALIRSHLLSLLSSSSTDPNQEPSTIPGVSNDDNISLTLHITDILQRVSPSRDDPILSFFKKYHYQSFRPSPLLPPNPNMYTLSRKFFTRNMGPILMTLGNFSLAGGFSSKKIMPVLKATGYLTTSNSCTVTRRLFETCQFVMDVMTKSPELAWESTTRVRFLHAQVRVRLHENGKAKDGEGVPINQVNTLFEKGNLLLIYSTISFSGNSNTYLRHSPPSPSFPCGLSALWESRMTWSKSKRILRTGKRLGST
jgi:hypothetical protein